MSNGEDDIRIDPITGEILPAGDAPSSPAAAFPAPSAAPPASPTMAAAPNVIEYSVSEISTAIRRTMEDTFGHVRVRGEVGRVSRPASGHVYLDLKDERSVLAAVIWRNTAARLRIQPEQGMEVVATGRLTTYAGQSKYQLVIERLEPAGIGALMALLEERKRKLAAEGLFDAARKRPLPWLPGVIGVVTSPSGAVIRDILHRLADRFPRHVIVWPVRVQGDTCAAEVARAIAGFNALPADGSGPLPRPDLLIVARGGGSLEDLWGFNEEVVVRTAAASRIPLISAVGHETDTTLIDLAADWRAPTPTAAAEKAVPVRAELLAWVRELGARLLRAMHNLRRQQAQRLLAAARALPRPEDILGLARQRLDHAASRLRAALMHQATRRRADLQRLSAALSPRMLRQHLRAQQQQLATLNHRRQQQMRTLLQSRRQQLRMLDDRWQRLMPRAMQPLHQHLQSLQWRLQQQARHLLPPRAQQLQQLERALASLDPRAVLRRGYALVHDATSDRLLHARAEVHPGQHLAIEFHDGRISAIADDAMTPETPNGGGNPATAARRHHSASTTRKRITSRNDDDPSQGNLF